MKLLYKFGRFSIDTQNKLLFEDEKPVQLKPKVFDTLLVLVEGKGNVLTKDTLMEKIWEDTIVEENNLQQNISKLRNVLGEAENGTPYIETIPRRGYRFAAKVIEIDENEELEVERRSITKITIDKKPESLPVEKVVSTLDGQPVTKTQTQVYIDAVTTTEAKTEVDTKVEVQTQTRKRVLVASAVVAVMIMSVAAWRFTPRFFNTPKRNQNFVLKQSQLIGIKNDGENLGINRGKLSPDGKMVVYSVEGLNNTENISVKVVNSDRILPITREQNNNWCPIWSADNSEIAFVSDRDGQKGLWRVHHLGGTATLVHHFTPYNPIAETAKPILESWSEDGKIIYYEWRSNFFALDIDSQEVTRLTNFDPAKSFAHDFSLSPNKEWIVYTDTINGQVDLWKISAKGQASTQLTNDSIREGNPIWSADGDSIIYTASQEGNQELRLYDFENNQSNALLSGIGEGQIFDVSHDKSKILYRVIKDEVDLQKINLASGEDVSITAEAGIEFWPDISPNGETVAFQAVKDSNEKTDPRKCSLLTKSLLPEGQTMQIASSASQAQWSPDGKILAFLQDDKGLSNLNVVNAIGGKVTQITKAGVYISGFASPPYNHTNDYSWSPDSSKLAYISKEDGLQNLSVISVDGSNEVKLSNNTDEKLLLENPFWSPDGKHIAYISDDYRNPQNGSRVFKVWIASLDNPEKPEVVFENNSFLKLTGWSNDNELIIALVDKKEGSPARTSNVDIYQITGKESQKLTTLKQTYLSNLHLSPNKKTIAFVAIQDKKSNIYTYTLKGGETKQITKNTDSKILISSLAWSSDEAFICYGRQERLNSFTIIDGLK